MKIFAYIILIFAILGTVGIAVKQPQMHTRVLIYDSQYKIVDEESKSKPVEMSVKEVELPTMPAENKLTREQVVFETQSQPTVNQNVKKYEQPQKVTQSVTSQAQTKIVPNKIVTTVPAANKTIKNKESIINQATVNPVQNTVVQQPVAKTVTQSVPSQQVKVLTAREEEIAWNIWRSNLQNQILKDCKLPIVPMGTVFRVSFDVDKNGRVSNVQTWSDNSKYTPYAIEFVAPVIRSYQGKSILEFPQGSQRTKTTFVGGWKISQTTKFSNPNDYNDIERVVK